MQVCHFVKQKVCSSKRVSCIEVNQRVWVEKKNRAAMVTWSEDKGEEGRLNNPDYSFSLQCSLTIQIIMVISETWLFSALMFPLGISSICKSPTGYRVIIVGYYVTGITFVDFCFFLYIFNFTENYSNSLYENQGLLCWQLPIVHSCDHICYANKAP